MLTLLCFDPAQTANGNRYEGTWFNDQKEGPGKFIYRSKRQCYEGEWAKDMPKCGTLRDLPPLAGTQPRMYPIPPVCPRHASTPFSHHTIILTQRTFLIQLALADPQSVLENERDLILEDRMQRMTGQIELEESDQ